MNRPARRLGGQSPGWPHPGLELWGGVEATVNRVGDIYFDQIRRSGHRDRIDDLDLFASLGIRAIRYPVLWEHTAPNGLREADWTWADERLTRLRELGIRPVVGLLHHGSGPPHTSLIDPAFPEQLAEYAHAVASRYPWITDYTPVNEPLTTARFSTLYGHWYPHERDNLSFARAVVNQCKATVLAMRAVRQVQPSARLVQTEDVGRTYSTPGLAYQAGYENERRWLTLDLLTGRLDEGHPMWSWLTWAGIEANQLEWFRDHTCPPDILAINHYLTSDRFLDERVDRYPGVDFGTNGRDSYVDVSALHVVDDGIAGFRAVLRDAWERYRRPVAIGEAHLGGSREEQLRWLNDAWSDALALRTEGVDVRSVTIWALLGSFDWTCLVTCDNGHYEPGPFDVRAPHPRRTALANMAEAIATTGECNHPVLATPGWWRRDDRLIFRDTNVNTPARVHAPDRGAKHECLMIAGSGSRLQTALMDASARRFIPACELIACGPSDVGYLLDQRHPWAVILADRLTGTPGQAAREWHHLLRAITTWCATNDVPMALFSSACVFDGRKNQPYVESDPAAPDVRLGEALFRAEDETSHAHAASLIIRAGPLFGPGSKIPANLLREDAVISPTYLPDLADATLDLLLDGERGIWHLANAGTTTGAGVISELRSLLLELPCRPATPPDDAKMQGLASDRGWLMSDWQHALARYVEWDREHAWETMAMDEGTFLRH